MLLAQIMATGGTEITWKLAGTQRGGTATCGSDGGSKYFPELEKQQKSEL